MDKFFEWLDHNRDIEKYDNEHGQHGMIIRQHTFDEAYVERKPQLLIGYMIEYLLIAGQISFRQFGIWLAEQIKERLSLRDGVVLNGNNHIEVIFDILKEKIEVKDEN